MTTFLVFLLVVVFGSLVRSVVKIAYQANFSGLFSATDVENWQDAVGVTAQPTTVLAAQPSTLTTRTSNTAGTLTMGNAGHGISTGQRLDLYWAGGQCYGAVAGTVAGLSVPIVSVSGGSNLPVATTAISVGIPVQVAFPVTGNNLTAFYAFNPSTLAYFVFDTSVPADAYALLVQSGRLQGWSNTDSGTNPLAGTTIATVWMSHNNQVQAYPNMGVMAVTH